MKKLWKTLLVTLLIVSMMSGMVTAFAADTDPADGEPQPTAVDEPQAGEPQVTDEPEGSADEGIVPPAQNSSPSGTDEPSFEGQIPPAETSNEGQTSPVESGDTNEAGPKETNTAGESGGTKTDPTDEPDTLTAPPAEPNDTPAEDGPNGDDTGLAPIAETVDGCYYIDCSATSGAVVKDGTLSVTVSFTIIGANATVTGKYSVSGVKEAATDKDLELHRATGGWVQQFTFNVASDATEVVFTLKDLKATSVDKIVELRPDSMWGNELRLQVVSSDSVADDEYKKDLSEKREQIKKDLKLEDGKDLYSDEAGYPYTASSWNDFVEFYQSAGAVLGDQAASEETVDNALRDLETAYKDLKKWGDNPLHKAADSLKTAIGKAQETVNKIAEDGSGRKEKAQRLLNTVNNAYKDIMDRGRLNEGESFWESSYDDCLKTAQDMLDKAQKIVAGKLPADTSALEALMAQARSDLADETFTKKYTEDSLADYKSQLPGLLEDIKEALKYEFIEQEEVDGFAKEIKGLQDRLVRVITPDYINELRQLLEANKDAGSKLDGDNLMAFERAQKMLTDLIAAYDKHEASFKSPEDVDTPISDEIAHTLEMAFKLAVEGKMPADRTELKKAVEAAKKALEKQKAFASKDEYKDLEAWVKSAEPAIDYKKNPSSTLMLPSRVNDFIWNLENKTATVLALKSDKVPKTGDPMVPVLAGGVVLMTLLAAAWVGKKALYRK